ncbi:hypothetical protein AB0M61_16930 [Streptomyces sp. NPDC051642]|uniref:hypothetical protein n=1 Tax=Streptomyces sp. NPDC051642 TaxID=3154646 RepID=UPI003429C8A7
MTTSEREELKRLRKQVRELVARGSRWPTKYTARTLGHPFLDTWRNRETELTTDPHARQAFQTALSQGDIPPLPIWAGEAVDLINDLPSTADLAARRSQPSRSRTSTTYPNALRWAGC